MTPTREQCFELLKRHDVPDNVIQHTLAVNKVARFIAKRFIDSGEDVNFRLVDAASLLHDLDKIQTLDNGDDHGHSAAEIIEAEGYPEVAHIVRHHIAERKDELKNWEGLIVNYADKRVNNDKIVSLKQRLAYAKKRYPEAFKKHPKLEDNFHELEKKVIEKINLDPRDLEVLNDQDF